MNGLGSAAVAKEVVWLATIIKEERKPSANVYLVKGLVLFLLITCSCIVSSSICGAIFCSTHFLCYMSSY